MPRPPRLHVPGAIYHVTLRGNHRQRIFHREADYGLLESLLAEIADDHQLKVHAYCWMPNHIHLALQVAQQPLARPMQRLASRFARRIQARLDTTGHLFERRYHAVLVDTERYLLALVRYIHLNPVRAGIVTRPEEYRWSSHLAYLAGPRPHWLTTSDVQYRLGRDASSVESAYRRLMLTEPTAAEVDYLRRRPTADGEEASPRGDCGTHRMADVESIHQLIADECHRLGISPGTLGSPVPGRPQAIVRARVAWRALRSGIVASVSELAPHLGRSGPTLRECLRAARLRRPDLFRPPQS